MNNKINLGDYCKGPFSGYYDYRKHNRKSTPETNTAMAWISIAFITLVLVCIFAA